MPYYEVEAYASDVIEASDKNAAVKMYKEAILHGSEELEVTAEERWL